MITVIKGQNMTDAQLEKVQLEKPKGVSDRWQGIKHFELVRTLESKMDANGWKFENRVISIDKTQFDMVGAWDVTLPGFQEMEEQRLALGFMTSNRCKRSLRLFVGSTVFVCNNGCATGEIAMAKKHTTGLLLEDEINSGLARYTELARMVPERTAKLKQVGLTDEQADHILMEAGRNGVIGFPRLGEISKEYFHPTFADNGSRTAWGLYNAFTYVLKKTCVNTQLDLLYRFQKMMPIASDEERMVEE